MTQERNEDPAVPKDRRKVVQTQGVECPGGGKGVPVNEQAWQPGLPFVTAENPDRGGKGIVGQAAFHLRKATRRAVPKAKSRDREDTSATMEDVTEALREAFQNVAGNKGAPGPDGQSIGQVREHLDELIPDLAQALLAGTYEPGNIRRVWIPKSGGGQRGLGIQNVVDRTVSEAVRVVLEPLYEPMFLPQSHGFRPGRSCHTAIAEAQQYVDEGFEWVVDLDLDKFFDRVPRQRLLARLSERVKDRRILKLIDRMLRAKVVMPDGVVVETVDGVPQGNPLSPLLSNIVLDELDQELARRGHRFVRYADDSNIYVQSERAGQRVMESVTRFITRRLRLKVNQEKSAVARPEERHFLGFRLRSKPLDGTVEVLLSKRSKERIDKKVCELTPRNWGGSLRACILSLNAYLLGWIGFFGICDGPDTERTLQRVDAHIRRRLRAVQLRHWKCKRTIAQKIIRLGVRPKTAWRNVYEGRKSIWALSHDPAVDRGLRNAYFAERGLISLWERWREKHIPEIVAPIQLPLALGYVEVVNRPASGLIT